jgi:amino acid adenylation domain-containing protein
MSRFLLTQAVDRGAERHPDREAVRCSGDSLTYAELARKTDQLARVLRDRGARRGDRVGIFMNKSLESVVSLYGAMKAGAAYVPLDPFAPPARVAFVLRDCGIRHLLTAPHKVDDLKEILREAPQVACVIGVDPTQVSAEGVTWDEVDQAPALPVPDGQAIDQDLAYILYTSGSTGTPKGIMHSHHSGLCFAEWAAEAYDLQPDDRLSNHAPLHFDLSTFDIFAGHIAGATTVLIPEGLTKFPASLSKLIQDERLSVWYSVPFALIQLLQRGQLTSRDLSRLRWVLFAGEPFPTKHLRSLMQALPQARFSNLYGPTETNVCTYYHVVSLPTEEESVPIGKPCANVEDLVIDDAGREVPPGEVGELVIRGGVVMRGYWGQPERTRQGFFRRPTLGDQEDTFYRTGDLVQLRPDGNYRYLGRKDRQIKTRGYRVELDEIEVALVALAGVEEGAVFAVPDGLGSLLIEAAVIPKPGVELSSSHVLEHLAARLPAYALPARVTLTQDFPRTSTGKINRRELQARAEAAIPNS